MKKILLTLCLFQFISLWSLAIEEDSLSSSSYSDTHYLYKKSSTFGLNPSLGTPRNYTNDVIDYSSSCALTDDTFILAHNNNDAGIGFILEVFVGQVNATGQISYGPAQQLMVDNPFFVNVVRLNDTQFLLVYNVEGTGIARVCSVSGSTVDFGTAFFFSFNGPSDIKVVTLSETKFMLAYEDFSQILYAIVGEISGTSISFGTENTITSSAGGGFDLDFASGNQVLFTFSTVVIGRVFLLTVTDLDFVITNSQVFYNGSSLLSPETVVLNPNDFIVFFEDGDQFNDLFGLFGNLTGTSFDFPQAPERISDRTPDFINGERLADNRLAIHYIDFDNGSSYTQVICVNAGLFDIGSETLVNASSSIEVEMAVLDGSDYIVSYNTSAGAFSRLVNSNAYTVTNLSDSGAGSLRSAIENSNFDSNSKTIDFAITSSGTILLNALLPSLDTPVEIDANNSGLAITLSGANLSVNGTGLRVNSPNTTIRNLNLTSFDIGIGVQDDNFTLDLSSIANSTTGLLVRGDNATITDNKIGTNISGFAAQPNTRGIYLDNCALSFLQNNLISGNTNEGIFIEGGDQHQIQFNNIGLNFPGTALLGNNQGIVMQGTSGATINNNLIADNTAEAILMNASEACIISQNNIGVQSDLASPAGNGGGIYVSGGSFDNLIDQNRITESNNASLGGISIDGASSLQNELLENLVYCNAGEEIRLLNGANANKLAPQITSATVNEVSGTCSSCANGEFIDLYTDGNTACAPNEGDAQARVLLGSTQVSGGTWILTSSSFNFSPSNGEQVTALASSTGLDFNNTSALSAPLTFLPLGSNCESAISLSLDVPCQTFNISGTASGNTLSSVTEPTCNFVNVDGWASFNGNGNTINIKYTSSNAKGVDLAVYTGNCPSSGGSLLACDANTGNQIASLSINTVNGQPYFIRIGNRTDTGDLNGELCICEEFTPIISGSPEACLDGQNTYTVSNGDPMSTFDWTVTGGIIVANPSPETISVEWQTEGAGLVEVTETQLSGCSGAGTLNVNVNLLPSNTIVGNDLACEGASETYSVATANPDQVYQWSVTGGTILTDPLGSSIEVAWSSGSGASVNLIIDDLVSGCSNTLDLPVTLSDNAPPSFSNPTNVNATSFTLTWEDIPNAQKYFLTIASDPDFTNIFSDYDVKEISTNTETVTGLSPNTEYFYLIAVESDCGVSSSSSSFSQFTSTLAPVALSATSISNTSFEANWEEALGAFFYTVEFTTEPTFADPIFLSSDALTALVSGLTGQTTYYYRVFAENEGGTSEASNVIIVNTLAATEAPSNLSTQVVSETSILLNWSDNSTIESEYLIERRLGLIGAFTEITRLPAGATSFTDQGLNSGQQYCYRVRASVDELGFSKYSNTACERTVNLPDAPSNLQAEVISFEQINLSWEASTATGVLGYRIERSSIFTQDAFQEIATIPAAQLSFEDLNVKGNTLYSYHVRAVNPSGNSPYSNIAIAQSPLDPELGIPSPPIDLEAISVSEDQIDIVWEYSVDPDVIFKIERSLGNASNFVEITSFVSQDLISTKIYHDTFEIVGGNTYFYRVKACTPGGESQYSNISSAIAVCNLEIVVIRDDSGEEIICGGKTASMTINSQVFNANYQWRKNGEDIPGAIYSVFYASETGQYSCEVSVAGSSDCNTVSINELLVVVLGSPDDVQIDLNGDVLQASIRDADHYQWYLDYQVIPGATDDFYQATEAGLYYVIATFAGCSATSNPFFFGITANEDLDFSANLSLAPNPAQESVKLQVDHPKRDQLQVFLVNNLGQKFLLHEGQKESLEWEALLPVAQYARGYYTIEVRLGQLRARKKILLH